LVSQHLLYYLKEDATVNERHLVLMGRNRSFFEMFWPACFLLWLDLSKAAVGREPIQESKSARRKLLVVLLKRWSVGLRGRRFAELGLSSWGSLLKRILFSLARLHLNKRMG
jgi:hypothetical protein